MELDHKTPCELWLFSWDSPPPGLLILCFWVPNKGIFRLVELDHETRVWFPATPCIPALVNIAVLMGFMRTTNFGLCRKYDHFLKISLEMHIWSYLPLHHTYRPAYIPEYISISTEAEVRWNNEVLNPWLLITVRARPELKCPFPVLPFHRWVIRISYI